MNVHGETRQGWSNFQIWAIWPFAPFSEPTAHFPWDPFDRDQWSMWGRLLRPIKTLIPYSYLHYTHIWLCLLLINTVCMCYVILSTWESTGRGKTSQGGSYTIHCAVCVKCSVQCVVWRGKSSCLTCVEIVCSLCVDCVQIVFSLCADCVLPVCRLCVNYVQLVCVQLHLYHVSQPFQAPASDVQKSLWMHFSLQEQQPSLLLVAKYCWKCEEKKIQTHLVSNWLDNILNERISSLKSKEKYPTSLQTWEHYKFREIQTLEFTFLDQEEK